MSGGRIVVAGGANVDIVGHPDRELVARDSNPGHVRLSPGGVGRNIAENLVRLGVQVELITALGNDIFSTFLAEECARDHIGLAHAVSVDAPGSLYLAILDACGDMALALNEMRALDALTPEALGLRSAAFEVADLVIADANLPQDSIAWLGTHVKAPLVLDAVSTAKAPRCRAAFGSLAALTCNAAETSVLLGHDVDERDPASVAGAARALANAGVERVFVTCGTRGVWFAGPEGDGSVPAPQVVVANATGAGDAFAAAVAFCLLAGTDTPTAARSGSALAALALESERTVSERIGPDSLAGLLGRNLT